MTNGWRTGKEWLNRPRFYSGVHVLLRYLHQELDENNSNRQVHTAVQQYRLYSTRFYVVMWHQILYFLQNLLIPLLLFTNKEMSSSKRRMDRGITDETSMPPFKFECFGSAA